MLASAALLWPFKGALCSFEEEILIRGELIFDAQTN